MCIKTLTTIGDNSTSLSSGSDIVLNVNIPNDGSDPDGSTLDIPTLDLNIQSTITFYEKDAPTIQAIDVKDMTGYNPDYLSTTESVNVARADYQVKQIKLNTWDPATQILPCDSQVQNVDENTVDEAPHTFDESLKVFYQRAHVYDDVPTLHNITAHLYVRFDPNQLEFIKMCQMQIQLFNYGVYGALAKLEAMDSRLYQTAENFPSFTTIPDTFAPSYYNMDNVNNIWQLRNKNRNLFKLTKRFTDVEIKKFVSSKSWGPDKVDITSVADLDTHYQVDGKIHIDDFLNWGYGVSFIFIFISFTIYDHLFFIYQLYNNILVYR